MKTAVIYARYSSDRQTEQSIEGQLHVCEDFAKRNDIIILGTYIDRAISGTHDMRENFQKMLKDSDNKKWDYVLVYKLDRFSRNKYEMAIHRKHLKDNGIKILSAVENIPETPEGTLLESLLEGMNQYYSEELSQKTKRGMNETRLKGNFIGGNVNFGYIKQGSKLVVNPDEAGIVVQIFTDYVNGMPMRQIAIKLNNLGIKNKGSKFLPSTIRYILSMEKYTGIYKINGQVYTKIYPPILDKNLYELARQKLERSRYGNRTANHVEYLLKNKVFCGYCGKKLIGTTAKRSTGELVRYYKCYGTKFQNLKLCPGKKMPKEFLEDVVNKAILKVFATPDNIALFADRVYNVHQKRVRADNSINILKQQLATVQKSLTNILNAIEQGIITETTKSRLEELERERQKITKNINEITSKDNSLLTKDDIKNFLTNSLKQSTENMISMLINGVYVFYDKIEIAFNYTKSQTEITNTKSAKIKLFTQRLVKTKRVKGGKIIKNEMDYKIYVRI